jgi:hypothetical protein
MVDESTIALRTAVEAHMRRTGSSFRVLSRDSGVPYTTIYNLLHRGSQPSHATATRLIRTIAEYQDPVKG